MERSMITESSILGLIGIAVMFIGLVMLIKDAVFKVRAVKTLGKVVSSRLDDKGRYIHTITYDVDGQSYSAEDSAGYSEPIPAGAERLILADRKTPEKFRFQDELRRGMIAFICCVVMGGLFILRFLLF